MSSVQEILVQVRNSISDPDSTYLSEAVDIGNAIRALDKATARIHAQFNGTQQESLQLGAELNRFLASAVSQVPLASTVVACFREQGTAPVAPKRRGRKPKVRDAESAPTVQPNALVKPKRKRRTKAEMAKARATEAAVDAAIEKAEKIIDQAMTLEEAGI